MEKLILQALLAFSLANLSFTKPQNSDAILGIWYCEEMDKSTFKITKDASGIFSAEIIGSSESSFVGKVVVKNVKYIAKENRWEGTIISIKRKKELDAVFTLLPTGNLKVDGSLLFFSKTYYWVKKN